LRKHGDALAGLEITTCLRDGELEIVTRYPPAAQAGYETFQRLVVAAHRDTVFSTDSRTVDDLVAEALLERGLTVATAESCTGGLLAGRLTARAGSSAYVLGGFVTYSNEAKHDLVGVPAELIDRVGAVSAEVAQAMASGARAALGADIGVGITGVAGPGGGSAEKPVGLVHLCVASGAASVARRVRLPGNRSDVRARAVVVAMHMFRELLTGAPGTRPAQG
jgi:nicotinamide-nucleotide amidase